MSSLVSWAVPTLMLRVCKYGRKKNLAHLAAERAAIWDAHGLANNARHLLLRWYSGQTTRVCLIRKNSLLPQLTIHLPCGRSESGDIYRTIASDG
jgi:hypothetical protein